MFSAQPTSCTSHLSFLVCELTLKGLKTHVSVEMEQAASEILPVLASVQIVKCASGKNAPHFTMTTQWTEGREDNGNGICSQLAVLARDWSWNYLHGVQKLLDLRHSIWIENQPLGLSQLLYDACGTSHREGGPIKEFGRHFFLRWKKTRLQ